MVTGVEQRVRHRLARTHGAGDAARSLDGLASGLSTALFTTIGGLAVFLFGQVALLVYHEWLEACERGTADAWEAER